MILVVPAQDRHELTVKLLESLYQTVDPSYPFKVVIVDNASKETYEGFFRKHYNLSVLDTVYPVEILRIDKNLGYYAPLKQIADAYPEENLIGLAHNDMIIYEHGWNARMEQAFEQDPQLMLVGLCGSYEVDERGGRGGGTMVNFRGAPGYQSPYAGAKYPGLVPSACLDSLFMMFRREGIEALQEDWDNVALCHFYDRIWPLKLVEQGYHVATLGVECDHMGGQTSVGNAQYRQDCIDWLTARGIPFEDPETEMYLAAERKYLGEYRDQKHFIPCRIREDYGYVKLGA